VRCAILAQSETGEIEMSLTDLPRLLGRALGGASVVALICGGPASASQSANVDQTADHQKTATPIKHVIVLIGEFTVSIISMPPSCRIVERR
jgi:hypothetical protein